MGGGNDQQQQQQDYGDDGGGEAGAVFVNAPQGPLGIDPLKFSLCLFLLLILYVFYLLLPRAIRKQYFGAYPKRHAWSARSRRRNFGASSVTSSSLGTGTTGLNTRHLHAQAANNNNNMGLANMNMGGDMHHHLHGGVGPGGGVHGHLPPSGPTHHHLMHAGATATHPGMGGAGGGGGPHQVYDDGSMGGGTPAAWQANDPHSMSHLHHASAAASQQQQLPTATSQHPNDEIVVSAAMQQLRDPGVLIVAHGSRGKPKTVRLQLTETAITWRTETRKKSSVPKLGKLHQVPLSHIMYVDVGKQTTALRRVENAQVSEALCFSLLTKEGSLDLEANSPRERDALVSCFSLVLDEVHAQNWRDIYRGPSSDMPSSFDELDQNNNNNNIPGGGGNGNAMMGGPEAKV